MFDYITLIFIVVLVLAFFIGFGRGAFNTLAGLAVFGAALAVAILVSKPLAAAVQGWSITANMNKGLFDFIAGKINVSFGLVNITGSTQITATELAAANAAGKLYYADPNYDIFHVAYESVHLPTAFYGTIDGLINEAIAGYNGQAFALAQPLADIMTRAICYAGSFLALFIVTAIVAGIIIAIIRASLKKAKPHIGLGSRFVGGLVGLAIGAGVVWTLCLLINVVLLMDNGFATHLKDVLRINDPNAWTFAKWLVQSNLGYNAIIGFFIK